MAAGGRLVEVDGEAYYLGAGWNSVPVYRVEGFDGFERSEGSIVLTEAREAVELSGDGLAVRLYADGNFDDSPDASALVGEIRGETAPGDGWPSEVDHKVAGVEFEAWLVPSMTADYQFLVYGGGQFRMWIDDEPVLDNYDVVEQQVLPGDPQQTRGDRVSAGTHLHSRRPGDESTGDRPRQVQERSVPVPRGR